jgi:ABC-type transporter Mla subunit MlaD
MKLPTPRFAASRRPASRTRGRTFLATLGAAGVLCAIALLYIGYHSPKSIPGRSYYMLHAQFDNADNLTSSYQVRIGGRLVGQVLNPRVRDGKALVDLQLDPKIKPLLSDTKLRVRPRSPVGVRFVELTPGTKGTPRGADATIPARQTSAAVQIDEALDTLDADHRRKTQMLLNELGKGFLSRGEDLNDAIGAAPATLRNLDAVAGTINARRGAVEGFVTGTESAAAAADPVRDAIGKGFEPEAQALKPFSEQGDAVRSLLDVAPRDLDSIRAGLARTDPLLTQLERFATYARPMLASARGTFSQTSSLLAEAPPGLTAADKTLRLLQRAVKPTLQLTSTLQPVLPIIDDTLQSSLPILGQLAPRDCDLRRFFDNWTDTLAFGDGYSNVLRFNVEGSAETLQGYTDKTAKLPGMFTSPYPAPCAVDHQKTYGGAR